MKSLEREITKLIFAESKCAKHKSCLVLIFEVGMKQHCFIIKKIAKNSYRTLHGKTSCTLAWGLCFYIYWWLIGFYIALSTGLYTTLIFHLFCIKFLCWHILNSSTIVILFCLLLHMKPVTFCYTWTWL